MKKKNIVAGVLVIILLLAIASFLVGIYKFFMLDNKSWLHYTVIVYTISTLIGVSWVVISCYKKRGNHKWPWLFLILLGVGGVSVNLATGSLEFDFIKLQIPYIMFQIDIEEPSYLNIAFPLGAVLYSLYYPGDLTGKTEE